MSDAETTRASIVAYLRAEAADCRAEAKRRRAAGEVEAAAEVDRSAMTLEVAASDVEARRDEGRGAA